MAARRPVLALTPGIGDIDVLVASELMEAARAVASGFVTPDRTVAIASTARAYVMDEKIAMGDGRRDAEALAQVLSRHARLGIVFDMDAVAREAGAIVNAVMLGALAGGGRLPIPAQTFEAAIRRDGKAVEANLRGFRAGLAAAETAAAGATSSPASTMSGGAAAPSLPDLEREIAAMPAPARGTLVQGVHRLVSYQDIAYARLYLDRLAPIAAADLRAGAGGKLLTETARLLALRMSYEDVVRVAQAKIDPARLARVVTASGARPGEPVIIAEFLKPGIEELCSILPVGLARRVLAVAERRGWLGRFYWSMQVESTSISGYLRFWLLARLRRWRPRSYRYAQEQRAIEAWLGLITRAAARSSELALEIVACARLIKGYGDTHKRGSDNYRLIETQVIAPALAGHIPLARAADAIANARTAALLDPDGESLARCLADIASASSTRIAAE